MKNQWNHPPISTNIHPLVHILFTQCINDGVALAFATATEPKKTWTTLLPNTHLSRQQTQTPYNMLLLETLSSTVGQAFNQPTPLAKCGYSILTCHHLHQQPHHQKRKRYDTCLALSMRLALNQDTIENRIAFYHVTHHCYLLLSPRGIKFDAGRFTT
jgi:hypothetical protein